MLTPNKPLVFVVDDDASVREAMTSLIESAGYSVASYASANSYLTAVKPDSPSCLVLDLQLPDSNGLEVQRRLLETDGPPVIFISGHGDIPTSVKAMRAGAIEFLQKPFDAEELLHTIASGIELDRQRRRDRDELLALRKRYATLTPREKEVLPLVVSGMANKVTASELGISEATIGVHRGQVMRKMQAQSLADLVRMADRLQLS